MRPPSRSAISGALRALSACALRALCLLALPLCSLAADAPGDPAAALRQAIGEACANPQAPARSRQVLADGAAIEITRIAPDGQLRGLRAVYEAAAGSGTHPEMIALAGPDCAIRNGRKLEYSPDGRAVAIRFLHADLSDSGAGELLDAPVPAAPDPGGVAVAQVDSGLNYLLPSIGPRLARDPDGAALGYDFWDMDPRPFDEDPSRSAFFPQRHGTKTASLLLDEAPYARLIPYRYPRADMSRMAALVDAAAKSGAGIVLIAMGSNQRDEWQAYEQAAKRHPDMLFIVSAGNDGRDLDREPVYPAALELENQLTVTSSETDGRLAPGSNWGRRSVDLLVPAERVLVTGFDGRRIFASGSSYAVPRAGALAACLLAAHPQWRAKELRAAILAGARPAADERWSRHGFLPDPTSRERGACPAAQTRVEERWTQVLAPPSSSVKRSKKLNLNIVALDGAGWEAPTVRAMAHGAATLLRQCGIVLGKVTVHHLSAPERLGYLTLETAQALVHAKTYAKPTAYLVADTRRPEPFDAEAFAPANSAATPLLTDTVWIRRGTPYPDIALAHELIHVLTNSGTHSTERGNLMRDQTALDNTKLSADQCREILSNGSARGLLTE